MKFFLLKTFKNNIKINIIVISQINNPRTIFSCQIKNEIIVYPNPTSDFLYIKINEDIKDLKVLNTLGESIYNLAPSERIDVSNLERGMYFIEINNQTFKFLKK